MVNNQSYILCGVVPWELKQRRRWRERKRQKNGRFRLAKQSIQPVRIHLQKKNAKNLTNWTRWNKRDYVWNSATSLIKWRFRSSRRFCCLKGSNENGKKSDRFKVSKKKTTLDLHHAFLYISKPSLHDYIVKMPNFTFCRGWEHKKTTFLYFS